MPDNGIQVLMFTHQSGTIWADIANIVWASGLRVSAAWYVVTETDSALREGSYVKGTVLLVLRKRLGQLSTFRDDLAMELEDEVKDQVATLTGLNQGTRDLYRDENLFADSDLQMAGYAAALRVLTRYAVIDGVDMTVEALRPRENGKGTRVDKLIEYAVEIANQCLIPSGIQEARWRELKPGERFYLKMLDMESHGHKALENYQNFAKAFKVRNFKPFMASQKANSARLYSATEFGRAEMAGESELAGTPLRAALYAMMELGRGTESEDVLSHLADNLPDYLRKRDTVAAIADFMASRLPSVREDEASNARVLRDLVRNERLA
jgi:putative DNA methylase